MLFAHAAVQVLTEAQQLLTSLRTMAELGGDVAMRELQLLHRYVLEQVAPFVHGSLDSEFVFPAYQMPVPQEP